MNEIRTEKRMNMPVSFYEVAWIFVIYAFLGWCTEVAYATLKTGKFVNRGFLNGPVCPIYGFGVLVVILVLTPLKHRILILLAGSIVLTTVIELITGFILEKLFHNQWWDYSDQRFNFHGYICLRFSILWGIACTLIMDVIHPTIHKVIQIVPETPGMVVLVIFCIVFGMDMIITINTILKFNERLKVLDEIEVKLKVVSNEIGENIYGGVTTVIEKSDGLKETFEIKSAEFSENHEELLENFSTLKNNINGKKEELAHLQAKYREVLERRSTGEKRLLQAFPDMKVNRYEESFKKLKKFIEEKRTDNHPKK
jgi:uncharacterized membrane protein